MKHTLFIFALLTASIQTFAQSPRIKLNQITKDSVTGSVLISSPTDSGMVYSRDLFISYGADTVLILGGDTLAATSSIISSVLSDGVTITGDGTIGSELTADTSVLATLRALSDSLALVISSVTADNVTITGDGTVGSPLKVDTATVISSVGRLLDSINNVRTDLDLKQDQLNGTGFVKASGTTITYDNSTYLTSEVDGSVTNEIQDISTTGAAGNISISSGSTLNLNVDDADASASNELQTLSYNSSTNEITLSDGGGTEDLSNLDLVDSTRINATGDTAYYYQNGVLIGTGAIAGGGGGSYNNISETFDTVYINSFLNVDNGTLYVDADSNRVAIGQTQNLTGAALSVRGGIHIIDPDTANFGDAVMYVYPKEQTTSGINAGEFFFTIAGPNSTSTDDGSIFAMRGNNFSRFPNARGAIFFGAGKVSSPIGSDGTITFNTAANDRLIIEADGDVVMSNDAFINGTTPVTSDFNLKNNINDYNAGLDKIMKLRSVSFYLNNDKNNSLNFGYIAQEVQDILPELIRQNNNTGYLYLIYENFIPIITNAIQEQQAIIESQASEIEKLKTLITDLSNRLQILENN